MRSVLIISEEYPPKEIGKTASIVKFFSDELLKRGFLVSVLTHDEFNVGTSVENSIRVTRVSSPVRTFYSIFALETYLTTQYIREGVNIILGEKADLIISFEWMGFLSAYMLSSKFSIPWVAVIQTSEKERSKDSFDLLSISIASIEKGLLKKASMILTNSLKTYETLINEYSIDSRKIVVVNLEAEYCVPFLLSMIIK
ncbi:MAG: glycosyltransferase family 4 protein [Thaumarchaeota archaeon]|nr:glycosyltransferase family 4 protein [Nitrososphaerota archaeon]